MDLVNAIAKVRFASAKPQRVQLHKGDSMLTDLLCMEPGQETEGQAGQWTYYVVAGTAAITGADGGGELPAGQLAAVPEGERHSITNVGEQRLICLVVGQRA